MHSSPKHMPTSLATMLGQLGPLLRHAPLVARSRKISGDTVSSDRFLLTFPRAAMLRPLDPRPLGELIGATLPDRLIRHWLRAEVVHLGLDDADTAGGKILKLYLEFSPETAPEQGLAYLALKAGSQAHLHRYDVVENSAPVLNDLSLPPVMQDFVRDLSATCPILRVSDSGSARLSLDIGLTDHPPDPRLLDRLGQIVSSVNPAATAPTAWPSHVAIGRDRNGTPFVTLYGWPDEALP